MAKKEDKQGKVMLERVYNVPLRKEWLKKPRYRRAKKAVTALRQFVEKHMKSENIKIGKYVNLEIWKHGIKNPPHHIKVVCKKYEDGKVDVELEKLPKRAMEEIKQKDQHKKDVEKEKIEKTKKEEKETPKEEPAELDNKVEEAKEQKQEEAKKIEQEELKELQKEHPKVHAPKQAFASKESITKRKERANFPTENM